MPNSMLEREEIFDEALERVQMSIDLEQPRTRLDEAHFLRGEILSAIGRCEEAWQAFQTVMDISPTSASPLFERARDLYDQIRFSDRRGGARRGRGCS